MGRQSDADFGYTDELRERMVRQLLAVDAIRTPQVAAAFRAVPRHLFVPEVSAAQAYRSEDAQVVKRAANGKVTSTVSAARMQAIMLEQAGVRPGTRVLEIGSGGCNAALLAELVGADGEVTTVDIDRDVTDRARRLLAETGYPQVRVVQADGALGEVLHAPYDCILVTVESADLPPAWTEQLAEGGRIVLPLRVHGTTRSLALERERDRFVGRDYQLCGFVPMQGAGESRVRNVVLDDTHGAEITLRLDGDGARTIAVGPLRAALAQPRVEVATPLTVDGFEELDRLDLWLADTLPGFALLAATPAARRIVLTASPGGAPTLLTDDGLAYRTLRRTGPDSGEFRLGACGHGPDAAALAHRVAEQIRAWDQGHRHDRPRFEVYPASTPDDRLPPGPVVERRHSRIAVTWPARR